MQNHVYLVCELSLDGEVNHRRLAKKMAEGGFKYNIIGVSQRIARVTTAIDTDILLKADWLCFSTPDAVNMFFKLFAGADINLPKVAAQDLATAVALSALGVKADFIPVRPLYLSNSFPWSPEDLLVAVDGQEWPGLETSINIPLTERKALFWQTEGKKALYLLSSPREAEYLLRGNIKDGIMLCKNPETAEKCWQNGCEKVVLPQDFTWLGMTGKLREILFAG